MEKVRFPITVIKARRPWRDIGGIGTRGVVRAMHYRAVPVGRYLIAWCGFRAIPPGTGGV